jgi:integrin alpha FG-GAP repeat containing protein 1
VHFGIGRSNNFVEQFTVSVATNGTRTQRVWTPIIPKSILFIDTATSGDPEDWGIDLLVQPTGKIMAVVICYSALLIILGLAILILHLLEKAEDEKDRRSVYDML